MQKVWLINCAFRDVHWASKRSIWSTRVGTNICLLSHCTATSATSGIHWMAVDCTIKLSDPTEVFKSVGCSTGSTRHLLAGIRVGEVATILLGRRRTGFLVGGFFHGKILGNGLFSSLMPPSKCSLQIRVSAVTVKVCSLEILVSHTRRTVLSCRNL